MHCPVTHLQATWRRRKELWPWYMGHHIESTVRRITNITTRGMSALSQCVNELAPARHLLRSSLAAYRTMMRTPERITLLTGASRYHWRRLVGGGGAPPPARPPWPPWPQ